MTEENSTQKGMLTEGWSLTRGSLSENVTEEKKLYKRGS